MENGMYTKTYVVVGPPPGWALFKTHSDSDGRQTFTFLGPLEPTSADSALPEKEETPL